LVILFSLVGPIACHLQNNITMSAGDLSIFSVKKNLPNTHKMLCVTNKLIAD